MAAVNELKQIPFGYLIGAPLMAAIESQARAAQSTIDFIKEIGFKSDDTDGFDITNDLSNDSDMGSIRNVTFTYEKKSLASESGEFSLTVPILTITPIPYIRIDEMTIDFQAKLTDAVATNATNSSETNTQLTANYKAFWSPVKVNFRVSSTSKSSSTRASSQKREYKMDIHVRAVQDEMPAGLSKMLDILEDAIKDTAEGTSTSPTPTGDGT